MTTPREAVSHPRPPAEQATAPTKRSKEMTSKIHRLIRRFSKELVDLVYAELGARTVKIKGKPGPKPGSKFRYGKCPLCGVENGRRRCGYICKKCSGGKHIPHKRQRPDRWGEGFKIEVPIPEGLPLRPQEVEVEDSEPDFLDRLVEIVPSEPKQAKPRKRSDDEGGFW